MPNVATFSVLALGTKFHFLDPHGQAFKQEWIKVEETRAAPVGSFMGGQGMVTVLDGEKVAWVAGDKLSAQIK